MVSFARSPVDFHWPLVQALVGNLPKLDLLPSTAIAIGTWLAQLEDAIEQVDAGQSIIVATPLAFIPTLFTRDGAEHAAAKAKIDAIAIDLAPLLASVRAAVAGLN